MKHGAVRKLTRAATMSFFALAATTSVAGLEVLAASPAMAMAQPDDPAGQGNGANNPGNGTNPAPGGPTDSVTKLVGGLTGGMV
jgi:hypothetical protein